MKDNNKRKKRKEEEESREREGRRKRNECELISNELIFSTYDLPVSVPVALHVLYY